MPTIVNFTKRVPPGKASRGTLAELVTKQKLLADQQAALGKPQEIQSWTQGLAQMTGALTTGLQQGRASADEAAGRARLAELQAGIKDDQATAEQVAQMSLIDPDTAEKYRQGAAEARAEARRAAEAARLHEDAQLEARTTLENTQGFTTSERVAEQGYKTGERVAEQGFTTTERVGGETAASTLQDNRLRADAEQADLDRRWKEQQPGSPAAQVFSDYQNGKFGELGSPEAIKAREDAFMQATGHSGDVIAREQLKSTETLAANEADAKVKAAEALANQAQTTTAKANQDYWNGKYGPPGSPEAIKRRDDEIAYATTHSPDTIMMQGDTTIRKKLYETMGTKIIPAYMSEAKAAGDMTRDMEILDTIDPSIQGPLVGRLAQMFPGFSSQAAVFEHIIKRAAPQQRAEGSGSTSDLEYNGMLQSLPQLINNPEANALIRESIKARAAIALERGRVIGEWQRSANDPEAENKLFDRLAQLDAKSIMNPKLQALIDASKEPANPTAPGAANGGAGAAPANTELDDALSRY